MKRTIASLIAGTAVALILTFGVLENYPPDRIAELRGALAAVAEACSDPSHEVDLSGPVTVLVEALEGPSQTVPLYGAGGIVEVRAVVRRAAQMLANPTTLGPQPGAVPVPATAACVRSTRDDAQRLAAALANGA